MCCIARATSTRCSEIVPNFGVRVNINNEPNSNTCNFFHSFLKMTYPKNYKPTVKLPSDCISDILKFVEDKSTLYSCLFVNHFCFYLILPKLWSNPFSFTLPTNKLSLIIQTFIRCLPQDRINYLIS